MTRRKQTAHDPVEHAESLFLTLMSREATPEDWDQYEYLKRRSPEYREVFARCEAAWRNLDDIGAGRLSDPGVAVNAGSGEKAKVNSRNTANIENPRGKARSSTVSATPGWLRKLRWSWAMAAGMIILVIVSGLGIRSVVNDTSEVMRFATQSGEHREVDLPDGSTLLLGGRSVVDVHYTGSTRLIELRSGEIIATVAHDVRRPFVVTTDNMMVMATGTAFNVRDGVEYSTVSVIEGAVRVVAQPAQDNSAQPRPGRSAPTESTFIDGATLQQGQQLRAASKGELMSKREVDIDQVTSWQTGQLYFLEDNLATVFESVARYSDTRFQLTDQSLRDRIYTGSFRTDSLEAWLDAIERAYSLKATSFGVDWIVLTPAD